MDSLAQDPGFEAPEVNELRPLFPEFEIEGFLAQGGTGAVYAARQNSLDRPVAIKILPREFGADAQFRAGFESEAKTMARLNHPNLIGVYDFGDADGYLFIIMELVDGSSLYEAAHGNVVDPAEAARLVAEICHGLAHAHRHGILHGDIRPGNILLAPGPRPKIGDFGLARPAGHDDGETAPGTAGYVAPEMADPAAADQRADIYSVGVMLHELLTGRLPEESSGPPSEMIGCDSRFDEIVRRATHPSPDWRYGDAEEMAEELEDLAGKLDGPLARGMVLASAPPSGAARPVYSGAGHPGVSPAKSRGGSGALVAALAIGTLAVVAFLVVNAMKDPPADANNDSSGAPELVPEPDTPEPEPVTPVVVDPDPEPVVVPEPEPEPVVAPAETVAESLARLRENLKRGDFTEMPGGTVTRGESRFLVVENRLDWREASRLAERHGAHLAVLESPEDLQWAVSSLKIAGPAWIGLSDSGTEGKWQWVNGNPIAEALWSPGQPGDSPSEDDGEDFAALLPGAMLNDLPGTQELAFVLQWPPESGEEAGFASQLARCGESLRAKQAPVFPAGSRNIGGSRFLVVPDAVSWEQASATAKAAGGHLAVPSTDAEAAWMAEELRRSLKPNEAAWTGGLRLPTAAWGFVTGERFDFVTWAPEQPDGMEDAPAYLQFRRSGEGEFGSHDAEVTDPEAVCYMIEWSAPSRRNMPSKGDRPPANAGEWLMAHREKTAGDNADDYKPFRRRWDKNVEDFVSDVRDRAKGAERFGGGGGGGRFGEAAKTYTSEIEEAGRIPDNVPAFTEWLIGEMHREALEEQTELWEKFEPKFEEALERYLAEVGVMAERLERLGKRDGADLLNREILATTADHNRFHDILNGENPPVPEN
jgi:predicted Ser/Thr protein kinase